MNRTLDMKNVIDIIGAEKVEEIKNKIFVSDNRTKNSPLISERLSQKKL